MRSAEISEGKSSNSPLKNQKSTQWGSELGVCAACGEGILGGSVVEEGDTKWHRRCFVC